MKPKHSSRNTQCIQRSCSEEIHKNNFSNPRKKQHGEKKGGERIYIFPHLRQHKLQTFQETEYITNRVYNLSCTTVQVTVGAKICEQLTYNKFSL